MILKSISALYCSKNLEIVIWTKAPFINIATPILIKLYQYNHLCILKQSLYKHKIAWIFSRPWQQF